MYDDEALTEYDGVIVLDHRGVPFSPERLKKISAMLRSKAQDIAAECLTKAKTDEERQGILTRLATYEPIRKGTQ